MDEKLGTRKELARLFDSCDFYVSPDTTSTAPVAEALFRGRLRDYRRWLERRSAAGIDVVKNSDRQVADHSLRWNCTCPTTAVAASALEVADMRRRCAGRSRFRPRSGCNSPPARWSSCAPGFLCEHHACHAGQRGGGLAGEGESKASRRPRSRARGTTRPISWCGLQLFHGKIPAINRSVCGQLLSGVTPFFRSFRRTVPSMLTSCRCRPGRSIASSRITFLSRPRTSWRSTLLPVASDLPRTRRGEAGDGEHVVVGRDPSRLTPKIHEYVNEVWVLQPACAGQFHPGRNRRRQDLGLAPVGVDPTLFRT